MTAAALLQVRPRRIVSYATIATVVVVGAMVTVGILLTNSDDGVSFRLADQIGLIGIGLLMGGLIMVAAARPRLRVDQDGLRVRNMVGHRDIPWQLVHRVSFPEGAQWPVLILADDETYPVIAIQAMDRQRAVEAMRSLRGLFDRFAANRPTPTPEAISSRDAELRKQETERPLGRLELIDLRRARKAK
jgi:hypothetical protein